MLTMCKVIFSVFLAELSHEILMTTLSGRDDSYSHFTEQGTGSERLRGVPIVTQPANGQAGMQISICGLLSQRVQFLFSSYISAFASTGLCNQLGRGPVLLYESPGPSSGPVTEQALLTVN